MTNTTKDLTANSGMVIPLSLVYWFGHLQMKRASQQLVLRCLRNRYAKPLNRKKCDFDKLQADYSDGLVKTRWKRF